MPEQSAAFNSATQHVISGIWDIENEPQTILTLSSTICGIKMKREPKNTT